MKTPNTKIAIVIAALITLLTAYGASAQVMGPLLPESAMEIGLWVRWVEADMDQGAATRHIGQHDFSIPMRYGVTRYATLSAEMFVGTEDTHAIETGLKYYKLGGGFQALVWEKGDYLVSGGVHFSETLLIDRAGGICDRSQLTLMAIMQVQRMFNYRDQDIAVWGGGVQYYFKDSVRQSNGCKYRAWNNSQTLGVAAGANLLLIDHVQLYYHFIYVDYYQPRVGVSYRF
jgi:hypothetical protein